MSSLMSLMSYIKSKGETLIRQPAKVMMLVLASETKSADIVLQTQKGKAGTSSIVAAASRENVCR